MSRRSWSVPLRAGKPSLSPWTLRRGAQTPLPLRSCSSTAATSLVHTAAHHPGLIVQDMQDDLPSDADPDEESDEVRPLTCWKVPS